MITVGISKAHLSRIERGERALDRRSEIVALANALQISPSELTALPIPAPINGGADAGIAAVRLALMAVNEGQPGGRVVPVEVLRARVTAVLDARCRCDRQDEAAAALPELIRDLVTSISVGRDVAALLSLTVLLLPRAPARGCGWSAVRWICGPKP